VIFFTFVVLFVVIGLFLSPFPYWPGYFRLWLTVIKDEGASSIKYRQLRFLVKTLLLTPLWGWLWLLDDLLFPAYKKREIQPVFIIGQPRCGTTLLHRTLAHDEQTFFAIKHIEWRYPFVIVQKAIQYFRLEKWISQSNYWPDSEAGRLAAKMHSNHLSDWEEDGIFFEENYLHHFFIFLRFPSPDLLSQVEAFPDLSVKSREKMLNTYHKVLQKMHYLRGQRQRFYLSKEVTSHNKIPFLLERYQDARFILTVRYADEFMSSLLALMRISTLSKTGVDPVVIDGWQEAVVNRMETDSILLVSLCRDIIPSSRLFEVSANVFMRQIEASTKELYPLLGLTMSDGFSQHLHDLECQQKKRERGYDYEKLNLSSFDAYDQFVREVDERVRQRMARVCHESRERE